MSPRPCADCGHPRFVHAPLILPARGHGCWAMRRALGHLVRYVPAGCPCPAWHDAVPARVRGEAA